MEAANHDVIKKPIRLSQQGLYRKPADENWSGAISFRLIDDSNEASQEALVKLCQAVYNNEIFKQQWVVGFSYEFSKNTIPFLGLSLEDYQQLDLPIGNDEHAFHDIEGDTKQFKNSEHHALILQYADNVATFLKQREELRRLIKEKLDGRVKTFETLGVFHPDLRIMGRRFAEGTNNARDYISLERHVLKTRENKVQGSTFMFTQFFEFDQKAMGILTDEEMENIIGRTVKHQAFVGSTDNSFSHVERIRTANAKTGLNFQMLRIPFLPLTNPDESTKATEMRSAEATKQILENCNIINPYDPSKNSASNENHLIERGLFFAGCCRSPARIKGLLDVMSGSFSRSDTCNGNAHEVPLYASPDRLLTYVNGISGGYFWIPSAQVLSHPELPKSLVDCGLHAIWDVDRRNEYMLFNMQQWSHVMSTGKYLENAKAKELTVADDIPSNRILHLCSSTFDQWRQRWFKEAPYVPMPHLEQILIDNPTFLPEDFVDLNGISPDVVHAKVEREDDRNVKFREFRDPIFAVPPMGHYIKDIPVIMRKGLAIREQMRLFTDKDRPDIRTAMDTYRLEPGEIIVGTLEEYSLGSGKVAVEYLCYGDERYRAKGATLSELSAMGHIVPDYGIILRKGLAAMIEDLEDRIKSAPDPNTNKKVHFWKGTKYALEGIDIYLANYAALAREIREQIEAGEYEGTNTMSGLQSYVPPDVFPSDFRELKRVLNLPIRFKTEKYRQNKAERTCTGAQADVEYLWTPTREQKRKNYDEIMNLRGLEDMLQALRTSRPNTLIQAVQLFFVTHASLHLTGDPVSAGRLDQLFQPFYDDDLEYYKHYVETKTKNMLPAKREISVKLAEVHYRRTAQDIIDALCLKWSEKINMNMTRIPDATSFGTTAVVFGTGPFGSGDSINQWFHQVSLGGMKENSNEIPEDGCNDITMLFLRSMRRLPLNAPCISLRVNEQTKPEILEEAAKGILSGGAHPIIFHDRNVSKGIHESLTEAYKNEDKHSRHFSPERLVAMSRQFACDGCYEPLISGYSDFSFLYVSPMQALECALNRGATYMTAGPDYHRGKVVNWNSPSVNEIQSFEHLLDLTFDFHLNQILHGFYSLPLFKFGALAEFCPSPLLSSLMHNAVERGRDMTEGGAMVHIVTPMFVGLANFIDSLFAIKVMVYHPKLKVTTLPELTHALVSNWGERDETWKPFVSASQIRQTANRFAHLRQLALSLPKFGGPDHVSDEFKKWINASMKATLRTELDEFGKSIAARIISKAKEVASEVYSEQNMKTLQDKYADPDFPFQFTVCVGAGTFENYVGTALDTGASADGRLAGQPFASDCSPAPSPIDLPPLSLSNPSQYRNILDALKAYDHESFRSGFANACEVDINITEDTSLEALHGFLRKYATNEVNAANLLTFTTGDPDRYEAGIKQPQQYELFRVRMGGWSNYYACMWLVHQKQHQRRPFYKIDSVELEQ